MSKERLKRAGEIFLIPFEKIVIGNEFNKHRTDFGDLNELAESIENCGLQIPIKVKKMKDEDKYILVQGKRRLRAIGILINRGVEFAGVKCFVVSPKYNVDDSLFDEINMNTGKPYSSLEQGSVFAQLVERGYSIVQISEKIPKSISYITNCIEIASLPKRIRDLVASGSVSGLTAVELSKVVDNEDELLKKLEDAVEAAPTDSEGKKKKVTKKNVKEVANLSPIKKLEEVKNILKAEGIETDAAKTFLTLMSRLKAGENAESLVELFK
jgi:ParB family chromosome partitioning protein